MSSEEVETFTERFNRLTAGLSNGQLMDIMELTISALLKIKNGETNTLKLRAGLRLSQNLGISPWSLIGENEPPHDIDFELDGTRLAIYAPSVGGDPAQARSARAFMTDALKTALSAKHYSGKGSVRLYDSRRRVYEGTEQQLGPDPDLVEMSRDLATLAKAMQEQQAEMARLRDLVEPNEPRARKRAV